MKQSMRISALVLICGVVVACAETRPTYESSWPKLLAHFSQCSGIHGYDPRYKQDLPEDRLAAGELEWRACAYQGIGTIMISASVAPESFRQLIREDKDMTSKIVAGELKRSERKARVLAILSEIRRQEDNRGRARKQKSAKDELRDLEQSRNRNARRAVRGFF